MGPALSRLLDRPVSDLWTMRNGYALCSESGLEAITRLIADGGEELRDGLRSSLRIGRHFGVEVTDVRDSKHRCVTQQFCSALPVAYGGGRRGAWEAFARVVLEAAYEATLVAAVDRVPNIVLLTRVWAAGHSAMPTNGSTTRSCARSRSWSMRGWISGSSVAAVSHPAFRAIAEQFNG